MHFKLENMTWERFKLAQRYGSDSYALYICTTHRARRDGGDVTVFESAAISNALLQYKAEVRRPGGIG